MAGYNTSSAHKIIDLAPPKPQRKPQLKVIKSRGRTLSSVFTPRVLSTFAIVVTMLSLIVYNQVCLNEVTGRINALNGELKILENEQALYISQLESSVSLHTVAQIAEDELGMNKLDKYQTVYVYLYEEDRINPSTPAELGREQGGILASIAGALSQVKEYISTD